MRRTTRLRWGIVLAVAIAAVALVPGVADAQCAMCRQALDSPEGRRMIAAFQSGILVLLAAPVSVFGIVAALAVRIQRRRQRAESDSSTRSRP
jgi:hypothetical protein